MCSSVLSAGPEPAARDCLLVEAVSPCCQGGFEGGISCRQQLKRDPSRQSQVYAIEQDPEVRVTMRPWLSKAFQSPQRVLGFRVMTRTVYLEMMVNRAVQI